MPSAETDRASAPKGRLARRPATAGRRGPRAGASAWLGLAAALGCARASAPWHVPTGSEARFAAAQDACRLLTDDEGGAPNADRFEACMKRRGWRHERFTDRWFD